MRRILICLLIVFSLTTLFAEFNPPAGEESYFRLLSPWLLGIGTSTVSTDAPAAASWNPAAAASTQRTTFDLGYVSIYDAEYGNGIAGHVLNLANTIPTKVGVFTWSGHFLSSDYEGIDLGTMGMVNAGFAKDVYDNLYVGSGINLYMGSNDSTDWGATLDLGFIHFLGNYHALNNFRWGITAKDFGLWYDPSDTYTSVPSPFTLQGGAAFTPVEKEGFSLDVNSDVVLPSFQDLRLNFGLLADIDNFLQIGVSSALDFGSIADGEFDSYRFIPSFGLRFSFQTDLSSSKILDFSSHGWDKGDIQPQFSVAPLGGGAWGAGVGVSLPLGIIDTTPPEINIDLGNLPYNEQPSDQNASNPDAPVSLLLPSAPLNENGKGFKTHKGAKHGAYVQDAGSKGAQKQEPEKNVLYKIPDAIYLSPNNDGVQDDLTFPFTIQDSRYIMGYALEIRNEQGDLVRSIGNKEERPQAVTFKDFFSRLFRTKSGIPIPDTLRWDGTTDDGSVAPAGVYSFTLVAWDDNGNRSESRQYPLVIDTRLPEVSIEEIPPLDLIFSPNDDGNKDTLTIDQTGTLEEKWNINISAVGGNDVYTKTLKDSEPSEFVWNGKNTAGSAIPDGIYTYTISAQDRAGNKVSKSVDNIIVDTQPRPVKITINTAYFSPNGDGNQDEVLFSLDIPTPDALTSWKLDVLDSRGRAVWVQSGTTDAPSSVAFKGRGNDSRILPEGSYTARLSAVYRNGNAPSDVSPSFQLDVTPPSASISAAPLIFSPNGDGNRDTTVITQDTSVEHEWVSSIIDSAGEVVRQYRWIEKPDAVLEWNGTSEKGDIVPDGDYRYRLSSTDRAGNSFSIVSQPIKVSTGETVVALFTDTDAFSPNGDGVKDVLLLKPKVKVAEGVESYTIEIRNSAGNSVKSYEGRGALGADYRWDGIGQNGERQPDGTYTAAIRVLDRNGNTAKSVSAPFVVDRVAPTARISAPYLLFSPNDDGSKDQLPVTQSGSSEDLWTGAVLNSAGETVRSYRWKGMPADFTWLGRDEAGNKVPDGTYTYRLETTDPAGNSARISLDGITLDTRKTSAYLTADGSRLSPNGDGKFDTVTFYPIVSIPDGIADWKLDLVGEKGTTYASFSGDNTVPKEIVWNGADADGKVKDGLYIPRFEVNYLKGDHPSAELKPVRVDATTPGVNIHAAPLPFSPDNDGVDDELHLSIKVQDLSPIDTWKLEIFDRQMNLFTSFSGTGMPADEIIWDGRSNTGELVIAAEDYPFRFTISDDVANTTVVTGSIPVDVLVIRDGDKLRIQIASIVFEPNSAKYSERDKQTAEKNIFVLDRIAEILEKYRNYSITIEGHANPVYYNDPVRGPTEEAQELQPLSEARAKAVRESLIERGINPNRLKVVGMGGTHTIADPGNRDVNWKNRRVEFILEK